MNLEVLPTRTAGAAENMALDYLMLQRYPRENVSRFRHYNWRSPSFTFGYSQKIAFVRTALPPEQNFDVCRRPTGGGIVDHRDDWTYALVIPRGHPLEETRATQSYREIHECLASALRHQGVPAVTQQATQAAPLEQPDASPRPRRDVTLTSPDQLGSSAARVCFERAELHDVVHETSGEKIAGAAQKRNKRGLLFQGSLWRPALRCTIDEDQLLDDFVIELSRLLGASRKDVPWPDFQEEEVSGLIETYGSAEWNESR